MDGWLVEAEAEAKSSSLQALFTHIRLPAAAPAAMQQVLRPAASELIQPSFAVVHNKALSSAYSKLGLMKN